MMWTCLIMSDTYVLKYGLLNNIIKASRVSQCLSSSHIHSVSSESNWLYFSYWIQTLSLVFIANVLYEVVNEINITGQHCILSSFSLLKMSARDKSKHNHAFSEILLMVLLSWGIFFSCLIWKICSKTWPWQNQSNLNWKVNSGTPMWNYKHY